MIGTSLAHYRITARLGAGGMGEVYRATDTRLGRDVAIKVLPAAFAEDKERLARLRREAQLLASLNHPSIAAIHGLEELDGKVALVLELVDGEDLAERLARGAIAVAEAVAIGKQIAEGLEAAHERGVVHRDLKPANVKLTRDGAVKILDFGLAKAWEGEATSAGDAGLSQSPTMSRSMTEAGVILGTAAYMSPEQARGRPVDKRADIWAFGVVLHEMLVGRRLFTGETVTDVLAAVLTREVDLKGLPAGTPRSVRRLLARCLDRDPRHRLRDIGEARIVLEAPSSSQEAPLSASAPPMPRWARAAPWALAATALAAAAWATSHRGRDGASREVANVDITFPADVEPVSGLQGGFAIAPDGRTVALIGVRGGVRRLFIRRFDGPDAVEIKDTPGVNSAVFSPDSASVAYVPGNITVTRLSLADQQRAVVGAGADLTGNTGWGPSGIFFTRGGALWIAPASGGDARQLTTLDAARREVIHSDVMELPEGRIALFSSLTSEPGTERIEAVSIEGGKRSVVIERAITPVWSPTGHLLYGREGAVYAVPFDPKSAAVRGTAVPVIPAGVIGTMRSGSLGFQLSRTGTLIFVPMDFDTKRVVSVGRDGSELPLDLPPSRYGTPRISPDGRRLLVEKTASVVESLDLARGTRAALTAAALGTSFPLWTSDGAAVAFRRFNLPFWASADGSGRAGMVPNGELNDYPTSAGPDPDSMITVRIQPKTSGDIFLMSISGRFPPKALLATPAYEGGAQLSPDGRWLVYQSNASGIPEIYVARFPGLERAWPVSEGGGVQPRWSPTGREIYYRSGGRLMAVAFDASGAEPSFGKPTSLFADDYDIGQGVSIANYDVTRDGRFVMLRRGTHGSTLHAVFNWTEELKRILARGGVN